MSQRRYNLRRSTLAQQIPPQRPRGSPKEPISRRKIAVEDLDLEKSYIGILVPPKRPQRPNKSRPWAKWTGAGPLTDPNKLPRGWHTNEDDLEIDDVDGQIERCHERIAENIMPHVFQQRLKEYTATKAKHEDIINSEPQDLTWNTIQRLHELEAMKKDLEDNGDESEQLPNIGALLNAYRSGKLEWNVGFVTYWSKGAQICQPRRFDWDEFEALNSKHGGHKGFWTEGVTGPGPESCYVGIKAARAVHRPKMHNVRLALRLPGVEWFTELDFVHDTGATMMSIYKEDMITLLGPYGATVGPNVPVMNVARTRTASGFLTRDVIEVEVTILDGNRQRMTSWSRIPCCLNPGHWTSDGVPRLDGPILCDLLYLGTAPASSFLYIATSKSGLGLPKLDLVQHPPSATNAQSRRLLLPAPAGARAIPSGQWEPGIPAPLAMPERGPEAPP